MEFARLSRRVVRFAALSMLLYLTLAPHTALSQQPPLTLASALDRLGTEAATLAHSLPSFTCQEDVTSQELQHNKVVRSVTFTATLRARRGDDGKLSENFEFKTVNGRPLTGGFTMPAYIEGGFSRALRYFAPEQQACYRYTLSHTPTGDRIDFTAATHLSRGNACTTEGTSGFALLDAEGNITHLERHVSAKYSHIYREAPFAAIDFAPLLLNGNTYRISRHLLADLANGGSVGRFEADYSGCKLFAATVTLGPAIEEPDATSTPHP